MNNKNLVIVESPTKARTIERFLDKSYIVKSSYGHIRDLPKREMGIDIENNFEPRYVIPTANRKKVTQLIKDAEKADTVILATDEDREGEAIAWHLISALKLQDKPTKRIAFHEITQEAIEEALKNPRHLDMNLVDAQQARRVLDRLVGYELSPFLWRKVAKGLSAGRVQSVAVRLIVEREREIQAFKTQEYWTIAGLFQKQNTSEQFTGKLQKINDKSLDKFVLSNEQAARDVLKKLENAKYSVEDIQRKEQKKNPYAPFTTSTLQQDANRRFNFSAKQTMVLAQQLYEGIKLGTEGEAGLITYMRTDSLNLADKFLSEAHNYIKTTYGDSYLQPRKYKTKSKGAQEAHEAIRPTSVANTPESVKDYLDERQFKLYQLIWQRAAASQMSPAVVDSTVVDVSTINLNEKHTFRSIGSIIKFAGFLKVYPTVIKEDILPQLAIQETVDLRELKPEQHFTQPPARYSDATLVKALEEYGIGRPSTYAPTIATITDRGYVEREERRLKPKEIAFLVNDVLVEHFPKIVDFKFTAKMEDDLDEVAEGKQKWQQSIREFYAPFKENLSVKDKELSKKDLTQEKSDEVCEKCGQPMVVKMSRHGKFLACSGFPGCRNAKPLNSAGEKQESPLTDEKCPNCGAPLVLRQGRYGQFMGCSKYPECKFIKKQHKSTGVKCPQCAKGEIVAKRSRRGKPFYACDQYPNCKFALWQRPTGEKCPQCTQLLTYASKDKIKCSNKECKFEKENKDKSVEG